MACCVQGRPKKARQVKSKVKSTLIIFFDIKGIVDKEFVLAGQSVSQFRLLLWRFIGTAWKCTKTSPRTLVTKKLAPSHASFFTREFFYQKQHDCHPPSTLRLCFPDWG
jgi:hypothetical protein